MVTAEEPSIEKGGFGWSSMSRRRISSRESLVEEGTNDGNTLEDNCSQSLFGNVTYKGIDNVNCLFSFILRKISPSYETEYQLSIVVL